MKPSTSKMETFQNCSNLSKKDKRSAAAYLKANYDTNPDLLNQFLEFILSLGKNIGDPEAIEWCRWLMAGGLTPEAFAREVKKYDNAATCGLVWTANFVAYRCRTCGISPCMSLCADCFQRGNHEGHDFNMFRSQAGGACDCGDIFVMKESGFCGRHGPQAQELKQPPPVDLLLLPHAMMPRLISRLMQHLRTFRPQSTRIIDEADNFLTMLQDFSGLGAAVRTVMTQVITDTEVYKELAEYYDPIHSQYQDALDILGPPQTADFRDCPSLQETLVHKTFLEELMFWTVRLEFPQKVVCLLLNMLPDPDYKEALTRSFVLHYNRIPMMLEKSSSPDTLSNRVVHVSVQLFSNEGLALRMTEQLSLLHVMVFSLKYMMNKILISNTLHDPAKNFHYVVDCGRQVMKEHCYWPLVSDLNNVLSHRPVALKFMSESNLLEMWFEFLSMFQGMNVNQREMTTHVEFEPSTYYAAFSAELEASAYPMWALVGHLKDSSTVHLTRSVLKACVAALQEWFDAINFREPTTKDFKQVSFHLPLHRYLAILMSQAVKCQGVTLKEVLPPADILPLIYQHPLRLQVAFYEILNGMWVRNGLQIKGQMMTYIQCNFCNSMVDADLYLLQVCATQIEPERFLLNVLDMFRVNEALSIAVLRTSPPFTEFDREYESAMVESTLTFLATLINIRSNLGANETWLSKLEMVTLLCMSDKTHSQLMELMPERCGTIQSRDFDAMLSEVADYRAPNNMQQGMYAPKPQVWEDLYDPIHVLLRAVHRRDFQTSMDRFTEYVQQTRKMKPGTENIWPPLRPPLPCGPAYEDPRKILQSRVFHAVIFCILYQAAERRNMSDHVLALAVYLLEMAVLSCEPAKSAELCQEESCQQFDVKDRDFANFYQSDWLSLNLRTVIVNQINKVLRDPETTEDEEGSLVDSFGFDDEEMDLDIMPFSDESPENLQPAITMATPGDTTLDFLGPALPSPQTRTDDPPTTSASGSLGATSSSAISIPIASSSQQGITYTTSLAIPGPSQQPVPSSSSRGVANYVPIRPPINSLRMLAMSMNLASGGMQSEALSTLFRPNAEISLPSITRGPKKSKKKKEDVAKDADLADISFNVGESIISLLLKLHAALSGEPDKYVMGQQSAEGLLDSRVGNGAFFVAKVLDRIAELDESCKECIQATIRKLWPQRDDEQGSEAKAKEALEKEERRRRAKERQQKLMEEFAAKQKQFMAKTMETEGAEDMEWNEDGEKKKCEYDCVICNQSSPSTADQPMGLVVLLQATSVLGHMKPDETETPLATSEAERQSLPRPAMADAFDERMSSLTNAFDIRSCQLSVNIGWQSGVHVQTCGHHLHLDCLAAYLLSLKGQQRPHSPQVDKGEYLCPLCRQLANSVLPLAAELGDLTAVVRVRPPGFAAQWAGITQMLSTISAAGPPSPLSEAMHKSMQDMSTTVGQHRKHRGPDPTTHESLFLFVSSIARTNLEIEMVQKGGGFLATSKESPLIPKRSCIVPLLHVLSIHSRVLAQWPVELQWRQLTDLPPALDTQLTGFTRDVPLMLVDPTALLIQLLLLLPLNIDQSNFSCLIKCIFNLLYFQVLTQISLRMTEEERSSWRDPRANESTEITTLDTAMGFVLSQLESLTPRPQDEEFVGDDTAMDTDSLSLSKTGLPEQGGAAAGAVGAVGGSSGSSEKPPQSETPSTSKPDEPLTTRETVEQLARSLCLPFLRIATLLRHHLFAEEIPQVTTQQTEFVRLVYYLELVTEGMDWNRFNASVALNLPQEGLHLPRAWFKQFCLSANWCNAASLSRSLHKVWHPPKLLSLPQLYDKIFQFYHARQCHHCNSVPREASLCLLCGTLVCLKENCCKESSTCEAVQHAMSCGAGTAMFLVVTSSYVIVIRGKRACLWGSVYLDSFGEEDRELKRGKPLYLCTERYRMLQEQWLAHRFDHTSKKWVWHRDAL